MEDSEKICRDCGRECGENYKCFPDPEADPLDFIYIFLCEECEKADD